MGARGGEEERREKRKKKSQKPRRCWEHRNGRKVGGAGRRSVLKPMGERDQGVVGDDSRNAKRTRNRRQDIRAGDQVLDGGSVVDCERTASVQREKEDGERRTLDVGELEALKRKGQQEVEEEEGRKSPREGASAAKGQRGVLTESCRAAGIILEPL